MIVYKNASFFLYIFLSKAQSVAGRAAAGALCSPLPVNPCSSVLGSKIFTFPPPDFALSVARRAPSLCSPLPANPCSSVSGSKIFTFPPPDFDLPGTLWLFPFAPPSPQTLVAPFRGAKSSHSRRRISPSLSPGARPLFAPRSPQTLVAPFRGAKSSHSPTVGFRPLCRPAAPSLCSPPPANPCSSVPGSKIFTFPPSDFVLPGARWLFPFAPRSPQTLVAPFRGAKSSHFRRQFRPPRRSAAPPCPPPRKPL